MNYRLRNTSLIGTRNSKNCNIVPLEISLLINKPEVFTIIKKDRQITAGILNAKSLGFPHDLFVKRFAPRNFLNFILKKTFGSRAKHIFKLSERLVDRGLSVPPPLSYIEPTFKAKDAFYISVVIVKSENLASVLMKTNFSESRIIASILAETLVRWHREGAVHGDLKWPNILLQEDENGKRFFLVDLDQARLYNKPNIAGIAKDLTRFYRAGLETGQEEWVDKVFFPIYMDMMSDKIKEHLDLPSIMNTALEKWRRKGQTRYQA